MCVATYVDEPLSALENLATRREKERRAIVHRAFSASWNTEKLLNIRRGLQKPKPAGRNESELFLSQIKHSGNKVSARCNQSRGRLHEARLCPRVRALHMHTRANTKRACTRTAVTHTARRSALEGLRLLHRNENSNVLNSAWPQQIVINPRETTISRAGAPRSFDVTNFFPSNFYIGT